MIKDFTKAFQDVETLKAIVTEGKMRFGLQNIIKILKNSRENPSDLKYRIFSHKFIEVEDMVRNLPISSYILGHRFVFLPKFSMQELNKVFRLKSCLVFAIREDACLDLLNPKVLEAMEEPEVKISHSNCPILSDESYLPT